MNESKTYSSTFGYFLELVTNGGGVLWIPLLPLLFFVTEKRTCTLARFFKCLIIITVAEKSAEGLVVHLTCGVTIFESVPALEKESGNTA